MSSCYFFGKFFKIYLSNKKFLKWCKRRRQHRVVLGPGRNVWFLSPLPSPPPPPPMLFALFTTSFKFLTILYPKTRQNDKINTSCVLWKNISFSSGTWVMTNVYALHLNPHVWRDPKVCVFELALYWQIIIKKWLLVDVLHQFAPDYKWRQQKLEFFFRYLVENFNFNIHLSNILVTFTINVKFLWFPI